MSFGLTPEGLNIKRLEDIKGEIENSLRSSFGNNVNLNSESVMGQIVGIFSERESLLWELFEDIYNSQFPSSAEGVSLELLGSINNITKLGATSSIVTLLAQGDPGTFIDIGLEVSQLGNELNVFITAETATIDSGQDSQQIITFNNIPDNGSYQLSYNGEETSQLQYDSNSLDVQTALNNLNSLSSVSVTGSFQNGFIVLFAGDDGLKPHPLIALHFSTLSSSGLATTVTVSEEVEGHAPRAFIQAVSQSKGSISANAGTLTVIETPITGLEEITNPEDAILGREEETDSEYRSRRDASLQIAGSGTVDAIRSRLLNLEGVTAVIIFENDTDIEDEDGRPRHSYEAVVQGGEEQEIFDEIWISKPAGIETFGNLEGTVVDSQGFNQLVKFSRPTELDVYLEIDISVDSAMFPQNGATTIEQAVLSWGNSLGIGYDVIVYPKLMAQLCVVDGVEDVAIRIGTSPNPTLDDNIQVSPNEISVFDTGRIDINIL